MSNTEIEQLIKNAHKKLYEIVELKSPTRIGYSTGSRNLLNVSKKYIYAEYLKNIFYWGEYSEESRNGHGICKSRFEDTTKNEIYDYEYIGHWENNKINKYGVYRITVIDNKTKKIKESLRLEGKFFKNIAPLSTGGGLNIPYTLSKVNASFESQIGGSIVLNKREISDGNINNFILKLGVITYEKDNKTYCFSVNRDKIVELENCIINDEDIKNAIKKARDDGKKAIQSAELSLKTIVNEGEEGLKNLEDGAIKIDERFKSYKEDKDIETDSLLNPHAISWVLSTQYINNNVSPNLGNNLARKMATYRHLLKNAEKMNNVVVYNSIFYISVLLWMDQYLYTAISNFNNDSSHIDRFKMFDESKNKTYSIGSFSKNSPCYFPVFRKLVFPEGNSRFDNKYKSLIQKEVRLSNKYSTTYDPFNLNAKLDNYLENVGKIGSNNFKLIMKKFDKLKTQIYDPFEKVYGRKDNTISMNESIIGRFWSKLVLFDRNGISASPKKNIEITKNLKEMCIIRDELKFKLPFIMQIIYDNNCVVNLKNEIGEYINDFKVNGIKRKDSSYGDNIENLLQKSLTAVSIYDEIIVSKEQLNKKYKKINKSIFDEILDITGNYGCYKKTVAKINLDLRNKSVFKDILLKKINESINLQRSSSVTSYNNHFFTGIKDYKLLCLDKYIQYFKLLIRFIYQDTSYNVILYKNETSDELDLDIYPNLPEFKDSQGNINKPENVYIQIVSLPTPVKDLNQQSLWQFHPMYYTTPVDIERMLFVKRQEKFMNSINIINSLGILKNNFINSKEFVSQEEQKISLRNNIFKILYTLTPGLEKFTSQVNTKEGLLTILARHRTSTDITLPVLENYTPIKFINELKENDDLIKMWKGMSKYNNFFNDDKHMKFLGGKNGIIVGRSMSSANAFLSGTKDSGGMVSKLKEGTKQRLNINKVTENCVYYTVFIPHTELDCGMEMDKRIHYGLNKTEYENFCKSLYKKMDNFVNNVKKKVRLTQYEQLVKSLVKENRKNNDKIEEQYIGVLIKDVPEYLLIPSIGTYYDIELGQLKKEDYSYLSKSNKFTTNEIIQSEYGTIPHSYPHYLRKEMPLIGIKKDSPKEIANISNFSILPPVSTVRMSKEIQLREFIKEDIFIHLFGEDNSFKQNVIPYQISYLMNNIYGRNSKAKDISIGNYFVNISKNTPTLEILNAWNNIYNMFNKNHNEYFAKMSEFNDEYEVRINKSLEDLQFHWKMLFVSNASNRSGSRIIRNAYNIYDASAENINYSCPFMDECEAKLFEKKNKEVEAKSVIDVKALDILSGGSKDEEKYDSVDIFGDLNKQIENLNKIKPEPKSSDYYNNLLKEKLEKKIKEIINNSKSLDEKIENKKLSKNKIIFLYKLFKSIYDLFLIVEMIINEEIIKKEKVNNLSKILKKLLEYFELNENIGLYFQDNINKFSKSTYEKYKNRMNKIYQRTLNYDNKSPTEKVENIENIENIYKELYHFLKYLKNKYSNNDSPYKMFCAPDNLENNKDIFDIMYKMIYNPTKEDEIIYCNLDIEDYAELDYLIYNCKKLGGKDEKKLNLILNNIKKIKIKFKEINREYIQIDKLNKYQKLKLSKLKSIFYEYVNEMRLDSTSSYFIKDYEYKRIENLINKITILFELCFMYQAKDYKLNVNDFEKEKIIDFKYFLLYYYKIKDDKTKINNFRLLLNELVFEILNEDNVYIKLDLTNIFNLLIKFHEDKNKKFIEKEKKNPVEVSSGFYNEFIEGNKNMEAIFKFFDSRTTIKVKVN